MKYLELNKIKKLYFGYEDISRVLGINPASARVSAVRYVKQGFLVKVKRNIYVLSERWRSLTKEELFNIANIIQVPSYISLVTALEFYNITTQVQRSFIESIALKRTKQVEVENVVFNYSRIRENLYSDFTRKNSFFIATAEKAFLDAVYFMSLGRYDLDFTAIDFEKFDKQRLEKLLKKYPKKTKNLLEKYGKFT